MKKAAFRTSLAVLALCLSGFGISAQAKSSDVTVELAAWKIVQATDGKEQKVSSESARPGEIIEHQAVYRNVGTSAVTNLMGTLPIPEGMAYVAGTAKPPVTSASLDGKKYAPVPLKRRVRLLNGKEDIRDVPPEEYRFLRWDLNELAAGAATTVSARMKVASIPEAAAPKAKTR